MKKILIFSLTLVALLCVFPLQPKADPVEGVVRFHVRANSDLPFDQAVKLKVRDQVVAFASHLTKNCQRSSEALSVISQNLGGFVSIADHVLRRNGANYRSRAYIRRELFPDRAYGECLFPEGIYTALRLDLGAAAGENFWCVLFPPICLADACSDEILDEYGVYAPKKGESAVVIRFKLWEEIKKLFRKR